jgi:dihydroorotate dehydrogenase electron transfer subunit
MDAGGPVAGASRAWSFELGTTTGPLACRLPACVAGNRPLGSLVWLTLEVPGWPGARPGQFVLLQAQDSRVFLGRALSVAQDEKELVSFLVAPVGTGTRELCALREGDKTWVVGPLGNGFDLDSLGGSSGRLVVVAGGVGLAPFPLLLACLRPATGTAGARSGEVLVLLGFRDAAQAAGARPVIDAAAGLGERGITCRTEVVTEDGALGRAQKVTETLQNELRPGDRLAVCGPWAMAEAVGRMCRDARDVKAWFSLEAGMACGVGSCHGCVIPLADGSHARVCREGPVFAGRDLFGADHCGPSGDSPAKMVQK